MEDKYSFLSGMKRSCRTGEQKRAAAMRCRGEGKFAQVHRKTNRIAKSTPTAGNGYGLYQAFSA